MYVGTGHVFDPTVQCTRILYGMYRKSGEGGGQLTAGQSFSYITFVKTA